MSNRLDRFKNALHIFGVLCIFVGVILLMPLLALPFYLDEVKYAIFFIIPAALVIFLGMILRSLKPKKDHRLSAQQDAVIVTGIWIINALFSAMPFVLSGMLNFTQAYFEAMSGWTTTGLSVVDVTTAPHIFLLFRSIIQFFGGVGLILVVVSALSETYGLKLYNAEGHSDKLLPNLAKSARFILKIYLGYFIAGTILYVIFGMPLFDAINHCMAALSTGGFSVKVDSIGAYNSIPIEFITVVLMILGATNFFANMLLLKRKFKKFFKLGEMRFLFILLGIAIPITAFVALAPLYSSIGHGLRVAFFNLISALTTTGFATVSYVNWPSFAVLMMILMMLIGGGVGSTAGGIKLGRIYIMFKVFIWNIKRRFMPERNMNELSVYMPQGKTFVDEKIYSDAANYIFIYLCIIAIGTGILASLGYTLQESLFEFASATGTAGLTIGITAPNMSPIAFWTLTTGMLLGRLEIYIVFIAAIKSWKSVSKTLIRAK